MEDSLEKAYGRGWAFPPVFTPEHGAGMSSGSENVRQSLVVLFSTLPGERIMRWGYGCDLNQFMFANINAGLMTGIESQIFDSVLSGEPRAEVTGIQINEAQTEPSRLQIQVTYRLRGSDISHKVTNQLDIVGGRSMVA
ncbi:GPW/gp25 family protein [Dyella choica]|uniref:Phage baseplate protein n=1 Tax=Dyella choica TaxID=1927959 RepID=A0A3S0RMP4_9GAMM|nr:GPW/gp25 family protein [Dyella choica]RUL78805.1 phage baseplate protein [Dyella choica]